MIGYGTLTIQDYEVLMSGVGSLTLSNLQTASVTMSGAGEMVTTASGNYGYALFPAAAGFGGDITSYGAGDASFPSIESYAEGGLYVPVLANYGFSTFPKMVSSGILGTVSYLDGDVLFPALMGKGGEGEYGEGTAEFPALVSSGIYDATPFERKLYSFCYTLDGFGRRPVFVVVLNASGQIVDTITGSHIYISQLLASMQATDTFTVLGSFLASLDASASVTGAVVAATGTSAALDATTRVWVVNMVTGASSQYDDYGFNSWFKDEETGEIFGLADDGIYRLDGDSDAGVQIDAEIEFGKTDHGTYLDKKATSVHVGISSDQKMYMKVQADGVEKIYQLDSYGSEIKARRVPVLYNHHGSYWNFTLMNADGCDFELAGIEWQFTPLTWKVK